MVFQNGDYESPFEQGIAGTGKIGCFVRLGEALEVIFFGRLGRFF